MTGEKPRRVRPSFLIALIALIAVIGVAAWFCVPTLINWYAQGKINEGIKALDLTKNVRYRRADHDLFTGVTTLYDLEIKLGESVSPVQVGELRIETYREENGIPLEVNFVVNNFLVTPACMANPQMELAMVVAGFDAVKGTLRCEAAVDSHDRTLKVRRFTMHLDQLIDASVTLEIDELNVDIWKNLDQGRESTPGTESQILEQTLAQATFVSLDAELVDLGLTDRIVNWGSRVTGSSKEQFRITTQQQIMSRLPDDLSMYRAPLAQIFRERSRIKLAMNPDKPVRLTGSLFANRQALQNLLGIKLEVTPVGH
jgi:hypothetical protein